MAVIDELVKYLREQQSKGYSITQLRSHLLQLGYSSEDIGKAIDRLYKQPKKKNISKFYIVAGLVILLIVLIAGLFFWFSGEETQIPETSTSDNFVEPSQDNKSDITVSEGQEPIPEDIDIFQSDIEKQLEDRRQQQQNDQTPAPSEAPTPIQDTETFVSFDQIVDQVRNAPLDQGKQLCTQLSPRDQPQCKRLLAVRHNQTELCSEIEETSTRDNCYMSFAYSEEYAVCDKIVNRYLQLSCRTLGRTARYDEDALLSQIMLDFNYNSSLNITSES